MQQILHSIDKFTRRRKICQWFSGDERRNDVIQENTGRKKSGSSSRPKVWSFKKNFQIVIKKIGEKIPISQ
ncbi:hypothetical protein HHI36_022268, partial [Cryptolaemus montrouzieri]